LHSFENKVALVTGGTKGIGKAVALRLAKGGADVAVNYFRSRDAANETVAELEELGSDAIAIRANVGKHELLHRVFDTIREKYGRLDILISNAALGLYTDALSIDDKAWDLSMHTNAQAFLLCVQHCVDMMPEGAKIVTLSSLGSHRYIDGYAAIGVSKAAIENLTKYLAYELAHKRINVNCVSGGFIDTDALKSFPSYDAMLEEVVRRTPFGRVGTADDVAGVISFLCSDEARWITGQTVIVDGDYTLA
jgi:enoyl-[acyl-carrier protein] reductase III